MPFKALGLHPSLVQACREMRYTQPTPVQAEAIPAILAGRDLIATAQTGTGKTAAFLLPILHQLLDLPRGSTQALVITPTRELAQQIDDVLLGLAYHIPVRAGLLVGGTAMGPQEKALRAGVEVLIATPGRLLDHMRQNQARFDHLHTLVLDEADRMLDMGFLPDLRRIIGRLPARRQTLLFSATMPPVIARLAREILRNPLSVTYEGVQKMPEPLEASKVRAGEEILRAIRQAEETLVRDVRADMTPTQMVERKLIALLKRSDAGVFIGYSNLGDMERKQRTSFQILSAVQNGRQRAVADRRIGDQAAGTNWVHFLQVVPQAMSELAPVPTSQAQPLIRL